MRAVFISMLAAGWLGLSAPALAEDGETPYLAVMGAGLVDPDALRVPELDNGFGLDLRYGAEWGSGWGHEYRVFYGTLEPLDPGLDSGNRGGIGGNVLYRLPPLFGVSLYALAGAGYVYADLLPEGPRTAPMLDAGLGLVTARLFDVFGIPLRARVEGRYAVEDFDETYEDVHAFAGVELVLAEPPPALPPEPEPEPVRVVRVEEETPPPAAPARPAGPQDADADGVADDRDRCPGTRARAPVDAEGCAIAKVLTLKGVTFELNSEQLRPESFPVLDRAAATLTRDFPSARVEIAGHTDSTGAEGYNRTLSMRRANSVRIYLIDQGVDGDRLTAVGYGEAEPVADNGTEAGRAENRRVELRVKEGGGERGPDSHTLNPNTRW